MRWEQRATHHACTKRIGVMLAIAAALALGVPQSAHAQRRGDRDGFMRYFGDPNEYYTPPAFHGNVK